MILVSAMECRRVILISAVLIFCACFLCSCFTLGSCPPGYVKYKGEFKSEYQEEGISDEALYSVLLWYSSENQDTKAGKAAASFCKNIGDKIFAAEARQVQERFAPLVRLDNGVPVLEPEMFSQNLGSKQGQAMLREIVSCYGKKAVIKIPVDECMRPGIWKRQGRRQRDRFREWAEKTIELPFPEKNGFSGKFFAQQAGEMLELVGHKIEIEKAIGEYRADVPDTPEKIITSLEKVSGIRKGLKNGFSLEKLGDNVLVPEFIGLCEKLPLDYIQYYLNRGHKDLTEEKSRLLAEGISSDNHTVEVVASMEKYLCKMLDATGRDSRFEAAVEKTAARFRELAGDLSAMRRTVWVNKIDELVRSGAYWDAFVQYQAFQKSLASYGSNDFKMYGDDMRRMLQDSLEKSFHAFIPEAVKVYYEAARHALEIDNRPSLAYSICVMLVRMVGEYRTDSLPQHVADGMKNVRDMLVRCRVSIEKGPLVRTVSIGEIKSGTPGIGITYRQDLENELNKFLKAFGLDKTVVFSEHGAVQRQWEYVAYSGIVGNFDGSESIERKTQRTVSRLSESRRLNNPDFSREAGADAPKKLNSRMMYQQDELRQIIHAREIERQAHVRVFLTFRGPGFSHVIEVNEFYTKSFFIEESHPFNDVRVAATRTYYDAMEVPKSDAEPELRYDRVWTPGQMLDWARKDSIGAMAAMLLYDINGYPIYLAEKVDKLNGGGNAEKAEIWAQCSLLCAMINTDKDVADMLKSDVPPIAKAYSDCLVRLRAQMQRIAEIKESAEDRMLDAASRYLVERQKK